MNNGHFRGCPANGNCWCEIKRYGIVFAIAAVILVLEVGGGFISGSLALLADAGHVFTDTAAIAVSVIVAYLVKRGRDEQSVRFVGGIINALLLLAVAIWVAVEAKDRLDHPREITSWVMILVAIAGTIGNYVQHRVLDMANEHHVTHEAMSLHVLSDLLQSVVVVFAGIAIALTGQHIIDPLLSFVIAGLMMFWALRLLMRLFSGHYNEEHECHHHHH